MELHKKKILIFGPISDFGGRELETGFIANVLSSKYEVNVCTSSTITKKSQLFDFNKNLLAYSVNDLIYRKFLNIKFLAIISYLKNGMNGEKSSYSNNVIAKKYFNYDKKRIIIINDLVKQYDLLFICAQFSTYLLTEIIQIAKDNNLKIVFRTTGLINLSNYNFINSVDIFIHHSINNAENIKKDKKHQYRIIDQCAFNEGELVDIPLVKNKISKFLTIARMVKEKNIDTVIKAFQKTKYEGDILYVVGDGSELKNLKRIANNDKDIIFTGFIENKKLNKYFAEVDCVIISYYKDETGPITGMEAMAASRLIISSKTGAMQERLPNYDYWYENSVSDLSKQILLVKDLNEKEVNNLSRRIRNRYFHQYSNTLIAEKYLDLINEAFEI